MRATLTLQVAVFMLGWKGEYARGNAEICLTNALQHLYTKSDSSDFGYFTKRSPSSMRIEVNPLARAHRPERSSPSGHTDSAKAL
jgi:hypothetical protein